MRGDIHKQSRSVKNRKQNQCAADIAAILNLSAKTVANYHTLIKQKLRVTGDVELVLLALRHNLL